MGPATTVFASLYVAITLALVFLASNYVLMAFLAVVHRHRSTTAPPLERTQLPVVTVQVPVFNEMHVVERVLDAVARLDYPRERLEIQVLDDSTDETSRLVEERAALHRERGMDVTVLHRADRAGFKAGALRAGLERARGEFVAVFDADFCPASDFLLKVLPHFAARPRLGLVQARWSCLNASYSLLTRIQALILDGHFMIEQTARCRAGLLMTFNGTGGVWRRRCIEDSGGWECESLAEDLDLSFRAHLAGWEFLFLPEVELPAEVSPDVAGFKRQQARWAQGAVQVLRKLAWRLLTSPRLSVKQKAMAMVHLSAYFGHPSLAMLLLLSPLLLTVPDKLRFDLGGLSLVFLGPPLFYCASQWLLHRGWGRSWVLPFLTLVGIGFAWSNGLGVWRGLTRFGGEFLRTPKFQLDGRRGRWRHSEYRLRIDATTVVELLLVLYALGTLALAWARHDHWMSPFALLCVLSFGFVGGLGVIQALAPRRPAA